jgi:glyoxylase-like metal-dependent hydrolase (beta-lactamase superfamily II)
LHELDAKAIREVDDGRVLSRLFNSPFPLFGVGRTVVDGDVLDLGGVGLEVLHTPGHTPGSICLYDRVDGVLFTGDTVFAEGVGRTDFAGGDAGALRESLERLVGFCEENGVEKIYPGHGPEGTPEDIRRTLQFYFQ